MQPGRGDKLEQTAGRSLKDVLHLIADLFDLIEDMGQGLGFDALRRLGLEGFFGGHDLAVLHHELEVGQDVFRRLLHLDQASGKNRGLPDGRLVQRVAVRALAKSRADAFEDMKKRRWRTRITRKQ